MNPAGPAAGASPGGPGSGELTRPAVAAERTADQDHMSLLVGSAAVVEGPRYTIDELARATGTTARTIRSYQDRGLLPPPQIVGRTGQYDADHETRLRVIARLLEERFSLASIAALLHAWETGESLAHILGFVDDLGDDPRDQVADQLADELRDQLGDGLGDDVEDGLHVTTAGLVAAGVPVDRMRAETAELRADCERIVRRFRALVDAHVPESEAFGGAHDVHDAGREGLLAALPGEVEALVRAGLRGGDPTAPGTSGSAGTDRRVDLRDAPRSRVGIRPDDRTNERALGAIDLTGNAVIADLTAGDHVAVHPADPTTHPAP